MTEASRLPLSKIEDIFENPVGSKFFMMLDLFLNLLADQNEQVLKEAYNVFNALVNVTVSCHANRADECARYILAHDGRDTLRFLVF